ncbi:MAG: 1,4-alpha-glucan branching protein GlgB [Acidobacteria bacterium]|nr:1,4-alpha-glucan branching protein GlgB [Acidobacteriota bacterium]
MSSSAPPGGSGSPFLTDYDLHLLAEGTHERSYDRLGSHVTRHRGTDGTHFAVWAPNARGVAVVGDFNGWDAAVHPMRGLPRAGIWEAFVPDVGHGALYKYEIGPRDGGDAVQKADPHAFAGEPRPRTASRVWDLSGYAWGDRDWMAERAGRQTHDAPISVYEVHLGSWMRVPGTGGWLTYADLAPRLADYAADLGFTHVELLPVAEHPLDESWGYGTLGYFAPTSRFGTPQEFMALVDTLHRRGVGVLVDWSAAHFPKDDHGLARFDGTHLYEHADPRQRDHPHWGSLIFNYGRREVRNFLIASALFWCDAYHVDGLRVDAVASMLYLDYGRADGEWVANRHGGRENLDAVHFLQRLNERVYAAHPGIMMVAEESTAWPGVTAPVDAGGLGFGFKWNLGWMNDTLRYFARDPVHRRHHQDELTFSLVYAFSENYILPLSHDEVVHGKGSLLAQMPGDEAQRHANLRLLFGFMVGHPGKQLLFMGNELAQAREWTSAESLDWHLLDDPLKGGLRRWVRDLNRCYRSEQSLYELDSEPSGFEWIARDDRASSVISFLRRGRLGRQLVVVCNCTPVARFDYRIGVPRGGAWRERLNSDASCYGGGGLGNLGRCVADDVPAHGRPYSLRLTLPPLSVLFLLVD